MLVIDAVVLYRDGKLDHARLRKQMVGIEDLNEIARDHGSSFYQEFESMVMEGDGKILAVNFKELKS